MIKIRDRFRPFSHRPGAKCMIPKSNWGVEAYPTEIRIFREEQVIPIYLELTGPVQGFTLEQDLEKEVVRLFGRAKEGYFNFEIAHEGRVITIVLKRGKSIAYRFGDKRGVLQRHQFLELSVEEASLPFHTERLSLGMNKKLDWDLVIRRLDLREILPVLFFLGQKIDPCDMQYTEPYLPQQFEGILVPLRKSRQGLGLKEETIPSTFQVSAVLRKSYEAIRNYFIEEVNGEVAILSNLPSEFVSGRMTCIKTSKAIFDIEWTKRKLRQMRIEALQEGVLSIRWPKEVDSFRLKHRPQEKGRMVNKDEELLLTSGQIYYLDKFQK